MTYDADEHPPHFPHERGAYDFHHGVPRTANPFALVRIAESMWLDSWDAAERAQAAKLAEAECAK